MAQIKVEPYLGKEKTRSIKKGLFYFSGIAGAITLVSIFYTFYTLYKVGFSIVEEVGFLQVWDMPMGWRLFFFFLLTQSMWLLWAGTRLWYKYASAQEAVGWQEERNQRLWDFIESHEGIMDKLKAAMVLDGGTHGLNKDDKFGLEDLELILKDQKKLEDLTT